MKRRGWRLALGALLAAMTAGSAAFGSLAVAPLLVQGGLALTAKAKGFTKPSLAAAIELAPLWLLATLIVLTRGV